MSKNNGTMVLGSQTFYLPFGDYRGTTPNQTLTDRGYTGHKENMELGLIYMNARYYLPGLARFASADTIIPDSSNPQSYNRYSYVLNSPLKYTDPTGHMEIDGCLSESCTLPNGMDANNAWRSPSGKFQSHDPILAEKFEDDYDALVLGASGNVKEGVIGPLGYSGSIGVEVVINFKTHEVTSFFYVGSSAGKSVGATAHGLVYIGGADNLKGGNYNYRGSFSTLTGEASSGLLGAAGGRAWVPGDNPLDPQQPYTDFIGWAPGLGAGVSYTDSHYFPIFTNNWETEESSWDIATYIPEFVTNLQQNVSNNLNELTQALSDLID